MAMIKSFLLAGLLSAFLIPALATDKASEPAVSGAWRMTSHQDDKGKTQTFPPKHPVVMTLSTGASTIKVTGGCNATQAIFKLEGDRMIVENLGWTLMACQPERLMEVDDLVRDILTADPMVKRVGDTLTLTTPNGALLRFVRQPR